MKKKIFLVAIVFVVSLVTALNANISPVPNCLMLENIEALASGENDDESSKECYWSYEYVGGKESIRTCSSSGWCIGYEGFKPTSTRKGRCIN